MTYPNIDGLDVKKVEEKLSEGLQDKDAKPLEELKVQKKTSLKDLGIERAI